MSREIGMLMRVLLVDGRDVVHFGVRELLRGELWVERLFSALSPAQAIALARSYTPHVALLGASLSIQRVSDLCPRIAAASPATRMLLLAAEPISARRAQAAGVAGAVPSNWRGRDIAGAARTVALGMSVFAAEAEPAERLLTSRELEVLELIGSGATNNEIAHQLTLSPNTVKDHTSTLYRKMKARGRAEAVVRAQQLGLLR
jgi:two-component system response regulator DesR